MIDQYQDHFYGDQFRLIRSPFLSGVLARLCAPTTFQPDINRFVEILYTQMINTVLDAEFPTQDFTAETRMTPLYKDGILRGENIISSQKTVVVNLARAGTFPSHICYHQLHYAIQGGKIRQDHIYASRMTAANDQVIGTKIGDAKIGGDIDKAIVLIPDPMGATGGTLDAVLHHYKKHVGGVADKFIAMHLIVSPEYLRKISATHPDLKVYALRVDRGLSSPQVQKEPLGRKWDQEKGLNDKGYIVPGGGGFGEIMNNSFV